MLHHPKANLELQNFVPFIRFVHKKRLPRHRSTQHNLYQELFRYPLILCDWLYQPGSFGWRVVT